MLPLNIILLWNTKLLSGTHFPFFFHLFSAWPESPPRCALWPRFSGPCSTYTVPVPPAWQKCLMVDGVIHIAFLQTRTQGMLRICTRERKLTPDEQAVVNRKAETSPGSGYWGIMTLKHPPGRNWKKEPSQLHAVFVADKQRKCNTAYVWFWGEVLFLCAKSC